MQNLRRIDRPVLYVTLTLQFKNPLFSGRTCSKEKGRRSPGVLFIFQGGKGPYARRRRRRRVVIVRLPAKSAHVVGSGTAAVALDKVALIA
jgi:hypothetical protein